MIVAHEVVSAASQVATSALAAALWQGALLAGAAGLGLRLLPATPAPVRFTIWFAVFLLVAGLPFATVSLGHGAAGAVASTSNAWLTVDARWCVWIAAVWGAASLVRGITLVAAAFRVRALWKRAEPIDLVLPTVNAREAQVCVSDEVDRPTVIGFFAPKIVIPAWLIGKLTAEELEQVVLHEAGHLSRRDDWLNLLQKIALVVFPLNPALAWVERRLCFERELACDETVLNATGAPKAYAECLATLAEYRLQRRGLVRGLALALGALGRESELTQRVLRILSGGARMKRGQARMVLGGATLSLVFAATALERSPQVVGFSHQAGTAAAHFGSSQHDSGYRAVPVGASVTPGQQWKAMGDAVPHLAKRLAVHSNAGVVAARNVTPEPKAVMVSARANGAPKSVASSKTGSVAALHSDAVPAEPEMIQTVATSRQMTADGRVVLTRWVTLTTLSPSTAANNRSDWSTPAAQDGQQGAPVQQQQQQQQVRPYAAVPVQGGWFVFQL